ncbi:MAG: glycoside hydrolase family 95-like protein [Dokdonella sp.]
MLRDAHERIYHEMYDRADLDLSSNVAGGGHNPNRAELLFHYGRYLLISSSQPGTQPTNLQGIWNVDVRPAWSCNFTVNINTQMNYWPAERVGLGELAEPLLQFVADGAKQVGVDAARRYYNANGAVVHHNTDIWHFSSPVQGDPQWANWPSGLMWLASHLRTHVDFGHASPNFIAEVALPVLREVVAFELDMLVDDSSGGLVVSPSTSPEHRFVTLDGFEASVSEGVAMDQELVREILDAYIAWADPTDAVDASLLPRARIALARLRLPQIGKSGALLEWYDDKTSSELGHRHLSHLYGLFPGRRITEGGTPEMFEAVRRSLADRLANGSGYTGWSQAWILCLSARLRDSTLAEQSFQGMLDKLTFKSLMVLHPHSGWPEGKVFQIDGNFGVVAGIVELLVQADREDICLLRTLPPNWREGSARGLRCIGGHSMDLDWTNGQLATATVHCAVSAPMVIEVSSDVTSVKIVADGDLEFYGVPLHSSIPARSRFQWQATKGVTYGISAQRTRP